MVVSEASFQRRQRGFLADLRGDHLVERRRHVRAGLAAVRMRTADSHVAGFSVCTEFALAAFSRLANEVSCCLYFSSGFMIVLSLKSAPEPLGVQASTSVPYGVLSMIAPCGM